MVSKICSKCNEDKPLERFTKRKISKDGYRGICKDCNNKRQNRSYRVRNGDKVIKTYIRNEENSQLRADRTRNYKESYKLTYEDVKKMHTKQNYTCAICTNKFEWLCVDHDHDTGVIRELLCRNCNTGIGMLGDNPKIIHMAFNYLVKHGKEVVKNES